MGEKQLISGDVHFYGVESCSMWISSLDMCLKNKYLELFSNVSFLEIKEESCRFFLLWILHENFCSVAIQRKLVWLMYVGIYRVKWKIRNYGLRLIEYSVGFFKWHCKYYWIFLKIFFRNYMSISERISLFGMVFID